MKTADIRVVNRLGLHARPSAALTQLASRYKCSVWLTRGPDGRRVNGKSIMGVMMLAAACGSQLTVEVDGEDEDEALAALLELIGSGFGEDIQGSAGC